MNLPRSIAWRYLRRPTDKLVSAVGLASVVGLVIGVMALVISMALMTGFGVSQTSSQRFWLSRSAHQSSYGVAYAEKASVPSDFGFTS